MMNYSDNLLGATISVSLFIQICVFYGALKLNFVEGSDNILSPDISWWEVQSEDDINLSLANSALHQYELDYRNILSQDGRFKGNEKELDELVEQRKAYFLTEHMRPGRPERPQSHYFEQEYYEEQICGIMHNVPKIKEGVVEEKQSRVITDGFAPMGCFYEDIYKKNLACNDKNMKQVPRLPSVLFRLHVSGTKIQEVNRTDFGDVSITSIQFIQNQITEMQPWAFSNVKNITSLEIMDNSLSYLAFDIYYGLTDLISLHLDGNQISFQIYQNCSMRNVSEIPHVLPKLRIFSLKRNPLKIIPAQMWGGLRESELGMLDISYCSLESIHEDSFLFLPQLKILYLTGNPKLMPTLTSAFEGLRNGLLEVLTLSNNGLHRFPTNAISIVAPTLLNLDLSGNPIAYLDSTDLPPNLTKLQILNMANCFLIALQDGMLNLMPNLVKLDLSYNYLTEFPNITNLKRLDYFSLRDNVILRDLSKPYVDENGGMERKFKIPTGSFTPSLSLRYLALTNTKVKEILNHTFAGLSKIDTLFLENTDLNWIEDGAFSSLESLRSLYLQNNGELTSVKPLNSMTFYGLDNLKHLSLANCNIKFKKFPTNDNNETTTEVQNREIVNKGVKSLSPDDLRPFMFLPSLEKLELSNNSITDMYPDLFSENMRLTQLLFDGNELQSWNIPLLKTNYTKKRMDIFGGNPGGVHIMFFLSTNKLSFITDAMIADLVSFEPTVVDFSTNTFMCDKGACALRNLINQSMDTTTDNFLSQNITWRNVETYRCVDPSSEVLMHIINITDDNCLSFNRSAPPTDNDPVYKDSNWTTIIIASTVSFAGVIALAVVGYKQRAQIRYLIFRAQLNISLPRKAKTSIAELIQFDFDVFISYHNDDRNFILEKFLPEIEDPMFSSEINPKASNNDIEIGSIKSTGFRVCLHERDFEAGMPITENILDAVDRSKKVVIVVSKKYLESQWCTFEMNLCYHHLVDSRRKSFVVIILEDIPSSLRTKVLNYLMRSRTYLEWPGESSEQDLQRFWSRLRSSFLATD